MKKLMIVTLLFFCSFPSIGQDETLSIVSYNLLNFPNGRDDCSNNIVVPNRADTLAKIISYIEPDILGVCEVQNQTGVDVILNNSLNINGKTNYATASFSADGPLNNALFYNTDKLELKAHLIVYAPLKIIDHYILYLKDPNLDVYYDTTFIEVFEMHLKAGNSSSDATLRASQTEALMDYIATRPPNRNIFIQGDLNVYTSTEEAYVNLTSGVHGLKDPIQTPGNWHNNSNFKAIHSQSTRLSENFDCGAKGGMDDRFDQILVSKNVMNNTYNVKYREGSYRAVGNDGNHFKGNLLSGSNSMYPYEIARALYYMSDHLPIELKVDITYPNSGLALVPSHTDVSCFGGNDGTATITPNLGEAPYSYLWDENSDNQTTATAIHLTSGNHCVTVTDNLGETSEYCIFINEPTELQASTFVSSDSGGCSGSIQVLTSGGLVPYTYFWEEIPEELTASVENLCAGVYHLTITDANGCELFIEKTVEGISGINSEEKGYSEITLFPNPLTNGNVNIKSPIPLERLEIYSINGMLLKSFHLNSVNEIKVDVSLLDAGVYLIKTSSKESITTKRLIKD